MQLSRRKALAIVAIASVLFVGSVYGWYQFAVIDSTSTIDEALSVTETSEFSVTMYPGTTNTWTFTIDNVAGAPSYTIKCELTNFDDADTDDPNDGVGVDITSFIVDAVDELSDLLDDNQAEFTIPAGPSSLSCSLTITAFGDATPGAITVELTFSRA